MGGGSAAACEAVCDATNGCGAFNTHGHLKKTDCLQKMKPEGSVDLYIRRDIPQPPPPAPAWGLIWPPPQIFTRTAGAIQISKTFQITTNSTSARLSRGIQRYRSIVAALFEGDGAAAAPTSRAGVGAAGDTGDSGDIGGAAVQLENLKVQVTSCDETLGPQTNYSYELRVSSGGALVTSQSIYGAMYGLETFSQLVSSSGTINGSEINVRDW
jgi:hypothetical protein